MTFKRRFILTLVLMLVIPALVLSLLAAILVTGTYISREADGQRPPEIVQVDSAALRAELSPGGDMFTLMLIWGISAVVCAAVSFSAGMFYITRKLLIPLRNLGAAVGEISAGNLSAEVLGSDVKEVDELCQAIDELRRRLRSSVSKQLETERERSMLLASLSHDLRTPITAIKGHAEGLRDGMADTPEMRMRYINTICSRANDMERMIEQASDFSELELGRMNFNFEIYDGAAELEAICRDYATDFEASGAEIEFVNRSGPAVINGDRLKLRRVYTNLFSNALKYRSPDRPLRVTVSTGISGRNFRITVGDNGIGIPAESLDKIFEGFYRVDPARGGRSGHGLGLAISRQIVEKHGGRIWAQSRPGEGTDICIALPLAGAETT